ncbi:MAG: acyl carrier protein [Sphingomonadales bacterium]
MQNISAKHSSADESVSERVRMVLGETLQLGARAESLTSASPLLGHLPELDSMAVASVLAGLEEAFDIFIEDDDISAQDFETFGSLCRFINEKVS